METASDAVTPEGLEERLRQRVLAAAPQSEKRIFRPRGYVRKAVLAAVLAVILTISAGAAVLLGWDKVFSRRFGEEAAQTPMGQAALQDDGRQQARMEAGRAASWDSRVAEMCHILKEKGIWK